MTKSEIIEEILRLEPHGPRADDLRIMPAAALQAHLDALREYHAPAPIPAPTQAVQAPMTPADPNAAGQALAAMVAPYLPAPTIDLEEIITNAEARLDAKITAATFPTRVIVERRETGQTRDLGIQHEQLPQLLRLVSRGINVWLYGAPGGGKTHVCEVVAQSLDLPFGFMAMSSQTTRTMLSGYTAPDGKVVSTPLRRAVENGGVFLFDEADKASPAILADIHSLMSQRRLATPDGHIDAHPDLVILVAANTAGLGGTHGHETAQKADGAFRDRFAMLEWRYDQKLERALALARNPDAGPWIDWTLAVRESVAKRPSEWRITVTPRVTYMLAELVQDSDVFSREVIVEMALFKGCDAQTRKAILDAHPLPPLRPAKAPRPANNTAPRMI